MSVAFKISGDLARQYARLRFDQAAEPVCCVVPLGSIFWRDEHPGGALPVKCDPESRRSVFELLEARRAFWQNEEIPPRLQQLWHDARRALPNWPGFQRLYLSGSDLAAARECERSSRDFLEGLFKQADEVSLGEEQDGRASFSATFNLGEKAADED